ncbi:MAG: response regulator [Treponema sp.]|jgi:signal transduction histidine kinase/DNA-binding response OmpR family regulator|nr:response regulator [Treponema sp.]
MFFISTLMQKIRKMRSVYVQILFTVLAFSAMAFLSYFFIRNTIHSNLERNAETMLDFTQYQIEAELKEPKTLANGFAQTIRSMILRGDSTADLNSYIIEMTSYFGASGSNILNSNSFFGYFETYPEGPVFLSGSGWEPPENFDPISRPWYSAAVSAGGEVVETLPYISMIMHDSTSRVITYACSIFDDYGRRLGVTCLNVWLREIGKTVVNIAYNQGCYGMLIGQDFSIIAHENPLFEGLNLFESPEAPLSAFAAEIKSNSNISMRPMVNWKGEKTVAFVRKLSNGWYLGLFMLERPFYQSLSNMASILAWLALSFSVVLMIILVRIDAARNKSDRESKHKSAFLANMSHEMRTPMNAIIGMTVIGKSAGDFERKDYCFKKIEDASNHLLGVINDILDMSKIEANKFELAPTEFVFEKMLQRVVNVINFRIDEKRQNFTVHIDSSIPRTLINDDQRLAQVITNLLSNAVKFTPESGSIALDTRFIEEKDNICVIQISVTDTGIGIKPEQQQRLFMSFEQAETSTTRKYGGTGLGLSISKSIVEMMGGNIWVKSEAGKGSVFAFTIKAQRGTGKAQRTLSNKINWENVRILAVDDDNDILLYFREITNNLGVYCDTAGSGEEALGLAERCGYHIYFVDWKMPVMNGIELAHELKSRVSANSVVIMISAYEWSAIAEEAKNKGVDFFVPKPLFPSSIAEAINNSLGMGQIKPEDSKKSIADEFAGRRLLVVEDVEINREILITLLEPTGIQIDCAENGVEAVRMFSEAPDKYDMIFMDVQMPEMDGYEATRRIRQLDVPNAKDIRIVAMTANVFHEDIEKCLDAGMDNHLSKPLDMEEVINTLYIYLPRK